jgi:hypothetical protein
MDIFPNLRNLGLRIGEGAVPSLPGKGNAQASLSVDPVGRLPFQVINHPGDALLGGEAHQAVKMVRGAVQGVEVNPLLRGGLTDMGEEVSTQLTNEEGGTVLGAPDEMDPEFVIGVSHRFLFW